jgi:hypothetical protein
MHNCLQNHRRRIAVLQKNEFTLATIMPELQALRTLKTKKSFKIMAQAVYV